MEGRNESENKEKEREGGREGGEEEERFVWLGDVKAVTA